MQSSKTESNAMLGVRIIESESGALVQLSGRFDIDSSPAVRDRLLPLVRRTAQYRVSIDLSAVTKVDSSGIATLIEALKIAHASRTELRLQGLHDDLLRLFQFTGILPLFNGDQTIGQSGSGVV